MTTRLPLNSAGRTNVLRYHPVPPVVKPPLTWLMASGSNGESRPGRSSMLQFFLIDTNVVHFESCRECCRGGIAAMFSPDGQIEDQKVGLAKRVLSLRVSFGSF